MITVKCIETGTLYVLSGDDESIHVSIQSPVVAALSGLLQNALSLKMHEKDLEYRIALAKLTGFNHAFHAHKRAYELKNQVTPKKYLHSTPQFMGKSYYKEFARKLNEKRLQTETKPKGPK